MSRTTRTRSERKRELAELLDGLPDDSTLRLAASAAWGAKRTLLEAREDEDARRLARKMLGPLAERFKLEVKPRNQHFPHVALLELDDAILIAYPGPRALELKENARHALRLLELCHGCGETGLFVGGLIRTLEDLGEALEIFDDDEREVEFCKACVRKRQRQEATQSS